MDKMDKNYQMLIEGVNKSVADPEDYKKFLEFYSKFPTRSFRNQMLIYSQREDASFVAGFRAWNKFGRKVNKGAKAIAILAPRMKTITEEDEKTGEKVKRKRLTGYQKVNVFDVKDTSGVPLPLNPIMPKNVTKSEFAEKTFHPVLEDLRKDLPITLNADFEGSGNGFYVPLQNRIEINALADRDLTNQFKTLIHEYAHSVFHNPSGQYVDSPTQTKELQAESVAYIVGKNFGMDTSEYSFPYIKGWAKDKSEDLLLSFQGDIQKESAAIIKRIEDVILEKRITFNAAMTLDENVTSLIEGEKKISLIQFGNTYCVAEGDFDESKLNNIENLKELGNTFKNKDLAVNRFHLRKAYLPLSDVKQVDKEKGNTHIYERRVLDPSDETEKIGYGIGVKSLANVKMVTPLSPNLSVAERELREILKVKALSKEQKINKELATKDSDRDGLTDLQEIKMGTNPYSSDTDNDGIPDHLDHRPTTPDKPQKVTLGRGL